MLRQEQERKAKASEKSRKSSMQEFSVSFHPKEVENPSAEILGGGGTHNVHEGRGVTSSIYEQQLYNKIGNCIHCKTTISFCKVRETAVQAMNDCGPFIVLVGLFVLSLFLPPATFAVFSRIGVRSLFFYFTSVAAGML